MGVSRALKMLDDTLREENGPVYLRKEIVNNLAFVEYYKSCGAIFVNEVDEVPEGATVVFSAHGVSPTVRKMARDRRLKTVDTTCPLVNKIHNEAVRFRNEGKEIVLIGLSGHKEVIGVMGEAPDHITLVENLSDVDSLQLRDPSNAAWLSQTTLNVDDTLEIVRKLEEKYPNIQGPARSDICQATKERQQAVKSFAHDCDLFIVVGSSNSSNTVRLAEVASEYGAKKVVRIDEAEELSALDFSPVERIGVTCGVSVSPEQLNRITTSLERRGYCCAGERSDASFGN
jgi:4-hydroxy-3-methylbut-2-enyl diphosphate reductase